MNIDIHFTLKNVPYKLSNMFVQLCYFYEFKSNSLIHELFFQASAYSPVNFFVALLHLQKCRIYENMNLSIY